MAAPIVGIDLGTTFSLVAIMTPDGPRVLPNVLGELLTPSVVSVGSDGELVVGAAPKALAHLLPDRTASSFKRDMGTDRQLRLADRSFTPQQLSALVLASLKRDAEAALGAPIEEAVITVPAYFGDLQRQATRDAASIAGLRVERLINEPTAAALAYGLDHRDRKARVIVLDLGGGTFDVTVLEIIEGIVEIQGSAGDVRLGGDDFDAALAERIAARATEADLDLDDRRNDTRLREAAERAKRRLTDQATTRLAVLDMTTRGGRPISLELVITREEAEECWQPLLHRMRAPIARALRDAGVSTAAIDEVLLVGGSTRMPCVARLAAQLFERMPTRGLPPDEAVALGAAVQAASKEGDRAVDDLVVTDVAPFTLGIATASRFGAQTVGGMFSPLIERGTVIPASRQARYFTTQHGQRSIKLEIYQGEHALCADNQRLGEYTVAELPSSPAGEQAIDVRFTYDLNGLLEVDVRVVSTGQAASILIERAPGALTEAQVKEARAAMRALKLHPRDALPNTTALARADALYVELTGPARTELGAVIGAFRAALDQQNPQTIESMRSHLATMTAALRHERQPPLGT